MSEETHDPQLSQDQKRLLTTVLDEIIPPSRDGLLPGAGEVGLVRYLEQVLQRTPALGPVITGGLSSIRDLAGRRGSQSFGSLSSQDRREVLTELGTTQPAFIPTLVLHTYAGYYQDARVVEALGLEARPPFPKGYDLGPTDFALLDPVRQRSIDSGR